MSKISIISVVLMSLCAASGSSLACGVDWRDPMAAGGAQSFSGDAGKLSVAGQGRLADLNSIKPILDPKSGRPIGYADAQGNTHLFPSIAQQERHAIGDRTALSTGGLYDCGGIMEVAGGGLWSGLSYTYATRSPDFWVGLFEKTDRNNTQKLIDELKKKQIQCDAISLACQTKAQKERRDACPGTKIKIGAKIWEIEFESGAACVVGAQWAGDRTIEQCDAAYADCMLGK